MLKIDNLTKAYGKHTVLDHCCLELKPYQIYGVLGKNGCGKSTLFKSIMGLIELEQGALLYKGEKLSFEHRQSFGYMPEQRSLLLDLNIYEQLKFLSELKKLTTSYYEDRIQNLVELFGLNDLMHSRIASLSKGQQQKVQLMAALLHEPDILILDEPLNGLDYSSVKYFMRYLRGYAAQGHSILLSSHQMEFMDELCTHVLILEQGKTLKQGSIDQLQQDQGVSLEVNAQTRWHQSAQKAYQVEDKGTFLELKYEDIESARNAIQSLSKDPYLRYLHLHQVSIGDLLESEK